MALYAQNKTVYVYDESSKQWYTASWIKRKYNSGKWYTFVNLFHVENRI